MTNKTFRHLIITLLCSCSMCLSSQNVQAAELTPPTGAYSYETKTTPHIIISYPDFISLDNAGNTLITWTPVSSSSYEVEMAANADFTDAVKFTTTKASLTLSTSDFGKNGDKQQNANGTFTRLNYNSNDDGWLDPKEVELLSELRTSYINYQKMVNGIRKNPLKSPVLKESNTYII